MRVSPSLLTAFAALAGFPAVSSAALVARYTFDDVLTPPSGGKYVNDSEPAGGNLGLSVSVNGPAFVPGFSGQALFSRGSGVAPAQSTANGGFLTGVPAITLLGWVNPAAFPTPGTDVGVITMLSTAGNGLNSRFVLALNSAGQVEVGARAQDASPYQSRYTSAALSLNEWTCVAAVVDYENDFIDIYINGERQALLPGSIAFSAGTTSTQPGAYFTVGGGTIPREYFHGAVDELSFYDTALGAEEIRALSQIPEPSAAALALPLLAGALFQRRRPARQPRSV